MRRADRLFRIVELLRRAKRRKLTARALAETLEVSERTVYRDVQALVSSGVPIVGEAGVGYALGAGFDLPPVMFDADELEALALGLRVVRAWGDSALAEGASRALAKIEAVLPPALRQRVEQSAVFAPGHHVPSAGFADALAVVRQAIRSHHRLRFDYTDVNAAATERVVRPLSLAFWGAKWTLGAWCELRDGFRVFALERVKNIVPLDVFSPEPGRTFDAFLEHVSGENARAFHRR
jgi:predicted DNA-binding transcriptional regulator YafY